MCGKRFRGRFTTEHEMFGCGASVAAGEHPHRHNHYHDAVIRTMYGLHALSLVGLDGAALHYLLANKSADTQWSPVGRS